MIPPDRIVELMREAIAEASKSVSEDFGVHPSVGAVIADSAGRIIAQAHRGESGTGDHAEYLAIEKAKSQGHLFAESTLLVTLEPCTTRSPDKIPCSSRILESGIKTVYIGILDPNPYICGRGETFLRYNNCEVGRFPMDLTKEIEQLNASFVDLHRSAHLPSSSLYVSVQISALILSHLQRQGLDIDHLPSDWDITLDDLSVCCNSVADLGKTFSLLNLLREARAAAFERKYADYSYEKDVRGLTDLWKHEVREILAGLGALDYPERRMINVGIGNGLEARGLFDMVSHLTAVDVAPKSLERARRHLRPGTRMICAEAEDLRGVGTASQDIYVSLRTYQSSYFDISRSIREAYRVVRQGGIVLVSVANGFIGENNAVIPGLVIPTSSTVNRDRPFELAELIRRRLMLFHFEDVGIRTGVGEIHVYGRRGR